MNLGTNIAIAHIQKVLFCKFAGECPLKDAEQNVKKKPVITVIFKLKGSGHLH